MPFRHYQVDVLFKVIKRNLKYIFCLVTNANMKKKNLDCFPSKHSTPATEVYYFWKQVERDIWTTNGTSLKKKYIIIEDSLLGLETILLTIKTPVHLYFISLQHKYLHCFSRLCTKSRFLKLQTIPSTFFLKLVKLYQHIHKKYDHQSISTLCKVYIKIEQRTMLH